MALVSFALLSQIKLYIYIYILKTPFFWDIASVFLALVVGIVDYPISIDTKKRPSMNLGRFKVWWTCNIDPGFAVEAPYQVSRCFAIQDTMLGRLRHGSSVFLQLGPLPSKPTHLLQEHILISQSQRSIESSRVHFKPHEVKGLCLLFINKSKFNPIHFTHEFAFFLDSITLSQRTNPFLWRWVLVLC